MKVPDGSCGSAIGAEQLTFIYGDVADRRHVRLGKKEKRAGEFVEIQICLLFLYKIPSPWGACGRKLVLIKF